MIFEICLFTNVHEINQQYKQKPITCLTGLFKLFVACSSWRILKHRLNHFFHCHLLRIFESFHDTSKIPTFTLLIKTNAHAQLHLKMLSCNFYFLKNLTDFRHIILQPAFNFNPNFLRENLIQNSFKEGVLQINHFFTSSISFLPNPIFLLLSFIFRFVYILGTHSLQKEDW